jgi:predicted alpha/beta-fold hydrolase
VIGVLSREQNELHQLHPSMTAQWGYTAPAWLPGGNLQTIVAAKLARRYQGMAPKWQRERWRTPDQDFIDVDWLQARTIAQQDNMQPLLVLFHGLEGSSQSHYAQSFANTAERLGWAMALPHFRGCSGEMNWAPRAYHSGDHEEIGWMLAQFKQRHSGPVYAVGVSLGGNALMRWTQEMGDDASRVVQAVASVCSPIDLTASGHAIGRGFNRWVYTRMFLKTMKPRALQKLAQYPGLFDPEALLRADDLYAFDNVFTAPLHGFKNTDDYWQRASAKPGLANIRIPALVLNAKNDPFIPAWCLPTQQEVGRYVRLWQPEQGGHVGFPEGAFPSHVQGLPAAIVDWLQNPV